LLNKGSAFPEDERRELGLNGLLPPGVSTPEVQLARIYGNYRQKTSNLERYIHLVSLQDRNETAFYRLLSEHLVEMMPIIYTPVVGEACQAYSRIYRRPRGLYISYPQRDAIDTALANLGPQDIRHRGRHRRRAHPRAGRSRYRRHGHPDRQAVAVHGVRRHPSGVDAAGHSRCRHEQPGAAERSLYVGWRMSASAAQSTTRSSKRS
jgi:hypothetical protein